MTGLANFETLLVPLGLHDSPAVVRTASPDDHLARAFENVNPLLELYSAIAEPLRLKLRSLKYV